jgi:serine/threonine-protein kinase
VSHAVDACEALQEAHALGIVHRDLKPGNLFLAKSAQGRSIVKVLDFGMSKLDSAMHEGGPLTRPETALGTPRYMAPEQWKSAANVDHTADIWALGVVMYELLTGRTPLHGMPVPERHARLLAGAIPSPRDLRPVVPEALARIVLRCLRADPGARWASVARLSSALRAAFPRIRRPGGEATEVTRTDVTAVVPAEEQARLAAQAFEPPTRRETPDARAPSPSSSDPTAVVPGIPIGLADDYDAQTVVRPPLFTPGDLVAASGEAPVEHAPRMSKTLRSLESPAEVKAALAVPTPAPQEESPLEKTQPLAKTVPLAPSVPPVGVQAAPLPAVQPPQTPRAPWVPEPPPRKSIAVYVVMAGLAALLVSAAVAWLVVRSLRP